MLLIYVKTQPIMKLAHKFLLLSILFSSTLSFARKNYNPELNFLSTLENGWYNATVQYSNYATGTNAKYTLSVKVEYDKVTIIDFGNGGSVHTGYNNEGYIFSGGYLKIEKDFSGNTIAAITTVSVSDSNGIRYYKIRIE